MDNAMDNAVDNGMDNVMDNIMDNVAIIALIWCWFPWDLLRRGRGISRVRSASIFTSWHNMYTVIDTYIITTYSNPPNKDRPIIYWGLELGLERFLSFWGYNYTI